MRTVKIVNHSREEAMTTELIVRGETILINENQGGDELQLQFDLCHPDDVDWIIKALSEVSASLKTRRRKEHDYAQITKDEAFRRFAELRREINERQESK